MDLQKNGLSRTHARDGHSEETDCGHNIGDEVFTLKRLGSRGRTSKSLKVLVFFYKKFNLKLRIPFDSKSITLGTLQLKFKQAKSLKV